MPTPRKLIKDPADAGPDEVTRTPRSDEEVEVQEALGFITLRDIIVAEMPEADHETRNRLHGIILHIEELKLKIRNAAGGVTESGRQRMRELYKAL